MRKNSRSTAGRNPESGYVLLLVFAMAAIVAVTLYMQVPRVAFEAQRDREELLMDRGHEYIRAITLFVHKFNRFPATMDELENTNRTRFLRRRYVDPMTGKADWRILHAGPGGVITDSVTAAKKTDTSTPGLISVMQMFGTEPEGGTEGVNLAARRRASDQAGAPGDAAGSGNGPVDNNVLSNSSNPPNPQAGNSGYNGPVMVLPDGRIVPATSTGAPAPAGTPAPGAPGFGVPGAAGASGAQLPSGVAIQQNALNGQSVPALPGQQQPPAGAASLINQILTTPRPGGINGLPGQPGAGGGIGTAGGSNPQTTPFGAAAPTSNTTTPIGQQVIGAGLAGVASKREQEGIKTYNQRTKYNEWEFVYDITKDPARSPQANGAGAAGASGGQGRSGQQQQYPPGPSMFGQSPQTPPPPPTGMAPTH